MNSKSIATNGRAAAMRLTERLMAGPRPAAFAPYFTGA
jgi:hypothetical protein